MVDSVALPEQKKMKGRYRDGYRVGKTIVGIGDVIKFLGGLLAVVIFGGALLQTAR